MAANFPDSPSVNDTYSIGSRTWSYDGQKWVLTSNVINLNDLGDVDLTTVLPTIGDFLSYDGTNWVSASVSGGNAAINVSDTAPVSPTEGDLWFNSLEATTYIYYDGYWIDIAGAAANLPELRQLTDVDADVLVNGDIPVYKQSTDQFVMMPIWEANPVTTTAISSSVSTTIGQFSTTYFTTGEFFVQITQGSKTTACKIIAAHNGSVADFTEYGTVEVGSPAIPVSFTAVLDEGNLKLKVSISDAASTNATVKVSKTVVGGL